MKLGTLLHKWEGWDVEVIDGAMQFETSQSSFESWIVGMWLIWKMLCGMKHKKNGCTWSNLQHECMSYIESYKAARDQMALANRVLPSEGDIKWKKPGKGRYRLYVDYVVQESRGKGGVGAILRDCVGGVVFAMAKPVVASNSILHGEIKAMMHGICHCIEVQKSPIEVYSDSMLAIIAVTEENEEASILYEELFDFFKMTKELNVSSFNHVRREGNMATHELARFARNLDSTVVRHELWPEWLLRIVKDDSS